MKEEKTRYFYTSLVFGDANVGVYEITPIVCETELMIYIDRSVACFDYRTHFSKEGLLIFTSFNKAKASIMAVLDARILKAQAVVTSITRERNRVEARFDAQTPQAE